MILEVEVLLQHIQQFIGGTEVGGIDPIGESFVSERVERGGDVQRLDVVGDGVLALLLDEVDRLARNEDLERHIITCEEWDEVHEDLEHFRPLLFFRAILVLRDEELA